MSGSRSKAFHPKKLAKAIQIISLGSAGLLTGLSIPALAQNTGESGAKLEEVTVTGTYIRGGDVVGSEVDIIDSSAVNDSGKVTLGDFLREIPENFAGGVAMSDEVQSGQDVGAAQSNLSGGQGVNLRGLGALSTLVLVENRRVAASGQFGDFVDISNIPAAAIERIEVLKDGASALYGSDAVGGVVNIKLKRKLDEHVTSVSFGDTSQGGGEQFQVNHLFGLNWDGGNAVVGFEHYTRDHVKVLDRDVYKNGNDFSSQGGVNWRRYTARYAPAATIFSGAQAVNGTVGATVPPGANVGITGADLIPVLDGVGPNTANVFDAMDLLPETERTSVFATFDHDFSESVSVYGDIRYTERESDYDLGYGYLIEDSLPTSSPFYIPGIDPALTNPDGSIPFGLVIDDRPETRTSSVDSIAGQLGTLIDLAGDWRLDLTVSYSKEEQNRYREQVANVGLRGQVNFVDCALQGPATTNPDCAALGLTPLNPWSTEPLSDAQLDELFGYEDLDFNSELIQFTAKVDGTLFELPAGPLKLAAGLDYREETMDGYLNWNTGSVNPLEGPYEETQRDATSAFAELAIPVTGALDLSLAARYEEFSGTGDYDTFNPKAGLNWNITDDLQFKASWGTSFHAPPMRFENDAPQPLPGGNAAFILPVSYFGPCDSTAVEFNGIIGTPGTPGQACSMSVIINSGGAGEGVLEPEEATTWTMGLSWEPAEVEGLRASIGYYNIEVDERIQRIQAGTLPGIVAEFFATGTSPFISALNINPDDADAQAIIDSPKFLGTFGPPFANTAADIAMIVNATQINIASLETSGFDFSLSYDFELAGGNAGVFINGTMILDYDTEAAPGAGVQDQLGQYSSFGAPVELRSIQGLRYSKGDLDATLSINYTDGYECAIGSCYVPDGATGAPTINTSPVKIDSWVTADLSVSYDLSRMGGFAEGVVVNFNVNNVFDEDPPFLDGGQNSSDNVPSAYDPNNHTVLGRSFGLSLTKVW